MSENLSPPAPTTVKQWLITAIATLKQAGIYSARLDALVLLEDELDKDRSWLLAHDETPLSDSSLENLTDKLARRAQHVPLAYIRGFIEFYGRQFHVTPSVLIPRPETEEMIELALNLELPADTHVIDVGTGSGCIGITLKAERPDWHVTATDISQEALEVAQKNANTLNADISLVQSDLLANPSLAAASPQPQLVAANLPYVAKGFEITPDAHAEPGLALYAEDEGYELIERLLPQASDVLLSGGYLLLESDPWQQDRIIKSAARHDFRMIEQRRFHLVLQKT